jgi:hypothetical protein
MTILWGPPDTCLHGHEYTFDNTRWYSHANGRKYRQCRACANKRNRLKYRNDAAHREREKERGRNYYHTHFKYAEKDSHP